MTARVTNGPVGPTVGCDVVVQISDDGEAWREFALVTAGTMGGTAYHFVFSVPPGVPLVRPVFRGGMGQSVTVEAVGLGVGAIAGADDWDGVLIHADECDERGLPGAAEAIRVLVGMVRDRGVGAFHRGRDRPRKTETFSGQ